MHFGLVGLMGAGKSHIGKLFAKKVYEATGEEVLPIDITFPMKDKAREIFGFDFIHEVEANKQELRVWLQEYGRCLRLFKGEDYLIIEAMKRGQQYPHGYIENVRMLNEYYKLSEYNWQIIGVQCDSQLRVARLAEKYGRLPTEAELNHPTELDVPKIFDMGIPVFQNDTPEDAENIAQWMAEQAIEEYHDRTNS
jgi:dephospho-CoA kinase